MLLDAIQVTCLIELNLG